LRSDQVLDLLLNFTAVYFIFSVDNVVFVLAKWGFIGKNIQDDSRAVASAKLSIDDMASEQKGWWSFPRTPVFLLILSAMIAFGIVISVKQAQGDYYVCKMVSVQFGNGLAPFDGPYTLEDTSH
jgi:hypothetical protein